MSKILNSLKEIEQNQGVAGKSFVPKRVKRRYGHPPQQFKEGIKHHNHRLLKVPVIASILFFIVSVLLVYKFTGNEMPTEHSEIIEATSPEPDFFRPTTLPLPSAGKSVADVETPNPASPPKQAAQSTPVHPEKMQSPPINRLFDASIKVQAIVWAPEPEKRMAVINNRVSTPGDKMEGYNIVSITEGAVIVSKDGRLWRALLGR